MEWSWVAMVLAGLCQADEVALTNLPPRQDVIDARAFNWAYLSHLRAQRSLDLNHWWDYETAIAETGRLYEIWDCLDSAQIVQMWTTRHTYLMRLRGLVGDSVYLAGKMPAPAPFHLFAEIR